MESSNLPTSHGQFQLFFLLCRQLQSNDGYTPPSSTPPPPHLSPTLPPAPVHSLLPSFHPQFQPSSSLLPLALGSIEHTSKSSHSHNLPLVRRFTSNPWTAPSPPPFHSGTTILVNATPSLTSLSPENPHPTPHSPTSFTFPPTPPRTFFFLARLFLHSLLHQWFLLFLLHHLLLHTGDHSGRVNHQFPIRVTPPLTTLLRVVQQKVAALF